VSTATMRKTIGLLVASGVGYSKKTFLQKPAENGGRQEWETQREYDEKN